MAEPIADGCKIDPSLQQIDRSRVSQRVRLQPFTRPRLSASEPLRQIFTKQIANSKPGERLATAVLEQIFLCGFIRCCGSCCGEFPKELCGSRPNWTEPHLVAFAQQTHLMR